MPVGCCTGPAAKYNIISPESFWPRSHPCLSEGPFLIFKIHADFVRMFPDSSLEDLGHRQVSLLIEIDQDQELEIPPGSPGIPPRGVVEQVERVVATGEEVGDEEEAQEHVGGDQVRGPAKRPEQVERDPGVHD